MKIVQCIIVVALLAVSVEGVIAGKGMSLGSKLPRTGQIVTYDSHGNEIDFLNSGQDGEFQRGMPWPEPRFIDNGDGTVTDSMTALMWLKDGKCLGKLNRYSAAKSVATFNSSPNLFGCGGYTASFSDWTLPSLDDLASLLNADEKVAANYLNLEGFSAVQSALYWTGSTYMNSFDAWAIDFANGTISYKDKMERYSLLAVRNSLLKKNKSTPARPSQEEERLPMGKIGRFIDNGDGTVSDTKTNLMWLKDAGCFSQVNWQKSLDAVAGFNRRPQESDCQEYSNDYDDWSLPNRIELRSLVDYNHDFPALPPMHPFHNTGSSYWTSTTDASEPIKSFDVNFYSGRVFDIEKSALLAAWPVRDIVATSRAPRKVAHSGIGSNIAEEFVMAITPDMRGALHWPPEPRFFNHGDGTSMDRITGIIWLTDGSCFKKVSWSETFELVTDFNKTPQEFGCEGYDANFSDWMVPTVTDLHELINKQVSDSSAWLNGQGVSNIRSGGDYWSATETMINLYYGDVISLKTGKIRNYPKSLKFFFWPRRTLPDVLSKEPLLSVTVNSIGDNISFEAGTPFTVALYLHTFGIRAASDFWVWYDSPDGQQVWLSGIRTWQSRMTPVYQGNLFNLNNFDIIKVTGSRLAPGDYTIHFAVDFEQNGILDNIRFENKVVVSIKVKE